MQAQAKILPPSTGMEELAGKGDMERT